MSAGDRASAPPRLRLAATLWSLLHHPTLKRKWTLQRKLTAVAEAGFFDGVQSVFRPAIGSLAEEHGLGVIEAFDADAPARFDEQVRQFTSR